MAVLAVVGVESRPFLMAPPAARVRALGAISPLFLPPPWVTVGGARLPEQANQQRPGSAHGSWGNSRGTEAFRPIPSAVLRAARQAFWLTSSWRVGIIEAAFGWDWMLR